MSTASKTKPTDHFVESENGWWEGILESNTPKLSGFAVKIYCHPGEYFEATLDSAFTDHTECYVDFAVDEMKDGNVKRISPGTVIGCTKESGMWTPISMRNLFQFVGEKPGTITVHVALSQGDLSGRYKFYKPFLTVRKVSFD